MKAFVTGVGGQLGHDCVNELLARGYEAVGSDVQPACAGAGGAAAVAPYVQLDITDREAVARAIEAARPDVIFHCAAWTAVDAAEDAENRGRVDAVNHLGTRYIAEAGNRG